VPTENVGKQISTPYARVGPSTTRRIRKTAPFTLRKSILNFSISGSSRYRSRYILDWFLELLVLVSANLIYRSVFLYVSTSPGVINTSQIIITAATGLKHAVVRVVRVVLYFYWSRGRVLFALCSRYICTVHRASLGH